MNQPCQRCRKRPASVRIADVLANKEVRDLALCEACAAELGVVQKVHKGVHELLSEMIQVKTQALEPDSDICPTCGMTWTHFKQSGLLGCAGDYELFADRLIPLLERAHAGASHHAGKTPRDAGRTAPPVTRIVQLRRELQDAVEQEDYERAASLRDQIRMNEETLQPPPSV